MPTSPISCRAGSHTHHAPGGELEVRRIDGGTTLAFSGRLGRNDAAVLSRCLNTQLDTAPRVLVLDFSDAEPAAPELLDILRYVRRRARTQNVGLHVLDRRDLRLGATLGLHQRRCELPGRYDHLSRRLSATSQAHLAHPAHRTQRGTSPARRRTGRDTRVRQSATSPHEIASGCSA